MKKREPWENYNLATEVGGIIIALSPLAFAVLWILRGCASA
mgnify:CR=1 FL=1